MTKRFWVSGGGFSDLFILYWKKCHGKTFEHVRTCCKRRSYKCSGTRFTSCMILGQLLVLFFTPLNRHSFHFGKTVMEAQWLIIFDAQFLAISSFQCDFSHLPRRDDLSPPAVMIMIIILLCFINPSTAWGLSCHTPTPSNLSTIFGANRVHSPDVLIARWGEGTKTFFSSFLPVCPC